MKALVAICSDLRPLLTEGVKFNLYLADRRYHPGGGGSDDLPGWDVVGAGSGIILAYLACMISTAVFQLSWGLVMSCFAIHVTLAFAVVPWLYSYLELYPDYEKGKYYSWADKGTLIRPFCRIK